MKLYIVTGTCGAGKSTIKDQLAEMLAYYKSKGCEVKAFTDK